MRTAECARNSSFEMSFQSCDGVDMTKEREKPLIVWQLSLNSLSSFLLTQGNQKSFPEQSHMHFGVRVRP